MSSRKKKEGRSGKISGGVIGEGRSKGSFFNGRNEREEGEKWRREERVLMELIREERGVIRAKEEEI